MDISKLKNYIKFDESKHKYYNKQGEEYISVSTLVKKYAPPFDPDGAIIKRCAERDGLSVEELRLQWDKIRDEASEKGKEIHSLVEHWIKFKEIKDSQYSHYINQISKLPFKGKLNSEVIIFSDKLKIAGTADIVDIYDNNKASLWDMKSNKELKKKSFWSKEQRGYQMMMYPVEHLMDCNYIHYSLQLSIYSIILEEHGLWMEDANLIYTNPKTNLIEIHPIKYLRNDALNIIKNYHDMQKW